jgi:hypothetical protein
MSLYDPPSFSVSEFTPCTCNAQYGNQLSHDDHCAKVDQSHTARDRGRDAVDRQRRYWFGAKKA